MESSTVEFFKWLTEYVFSGFWVWLGFLFLVGFFRPFKLKSEYRIEK